MHELSNDGARAQFDKLINKVLLPVMVDCAKVGGAVGGAAPHCSTNVHDTLPVRSVIGRMCWCGCVDAIEREECSVSVFVDHFTVSSSALQPLFGCRLLATKAH